MGSIGGVPAELNFGNAVDLKGGISSPHRTYVHGIVAVFAVADRMKDEACPRFQDFYRFYETQGDFSCFP